MTRERENTGIIMGFFFGAILGLNILICIEQVRSTETLNLHHNITHERAKLLHKHLDSIERKCSPQQAVNANEERLSGIKHSLTTVEQRHDEITGDTP